MEKTLNSLETPPLFSNQALVRLIIPLLFEQFMAITIGLADTFMVSSLSEAAISSVSLVDSINLLMSNMFSALATGGAVVAAQYIGHHDRANACDTARQLCQTVLAVALVIMTLVLILNQRILSLVFGNIEDAVMENAIPYFAITAISYPFLALYNASAALFRAMGNSKVSMWTALTMNILNIVGNAIAIFGLGWGVAGAAASTLLSRIVGAAIMLWLITRNSQPIFIAQIHKIRFRWDNIRRILNIGVPNGIENSIFQIGKLLVANLIASFGTSAIAANAVGGSLSSLVIIPGSACSLALITVVGQCMGAGQPDQAAKNTKKILGAGIAGVGVLGLLVFIFLPTIIGQFNLSETAYDLVLQIMRIYCPVSVVFWSLSFALPSALRGAGDARFTLVVSMISMWTFRIGFSYLLGKVMGMGLHGVWIAMYIDWIARGACFCLRFRSGRWRTLRVI